MLANLITSVVLLGCGDSMVERIDWTQVTYEDQRPVEAKLHGAAGWEKSPDGWQTHPVGGTLLGFVDLACASGDSSCSQTLASFIALAGTGRPLFFSGNFSDVSQPPMIHAEGEVTQPLLGVPWPGNPQPTGASLNPALWPTVQSMPPNAQPAAAQPPPPEDVSTAPTRGCEVASGPLLLGALALTAARRRACSPWRGGARAAPRR